MNHQRHNFNKKTIEILSKRVAFRCSNPDCNKLTVAASKDSLVTSTTIGVAAHITAAAPGGPRYDEMLTQPERVSANNGIWLCSECSIIIDREPLSHPTDLLMNWKETTESKVRQEFELAVKQIKQLSEYRIKRDTNNCGDNILVRKALTVAEVGEFINLIGYDTVLRKIDEAKDLELFFNELSCYCSLDYPQLITFSYNTDKLHFGMASILKVDFKGKHEQRIFNSSDSVLETIRIFKMHICHNENEYEVTINQKSTVLYVVSGSGMLKSLPLKLEFFTLAKPKALKIDYLDVYVELFAIDFVLRQLMGIEKIAWEISLQPITTSTQKLKKIIKNPHYWLITGKILNEKFIEFNFYKGIADKFKVLPVTKYERLKLLLKTRIVANYDGLKMLNFSSDFLDYWLNN